MLDPDPGRRLHPDPQPCGANPLTRRGIYIFTQYYANHVIVISVSVTDPYYICLDPDHTVE